MPRNKKKRFCRFLRKGNFLNEKDNSQKEIQIDLDEFEAMRLCDLENFNQMEAGQIMQVSRATIQRLLMSARKKVVEAILHSKKITIKDKENHIIFQRRKMMENKMRVAFPTNDKINVEEHFGHCKYFAIYQIEDKKIVAKEYVEAPEHVPGLMPKFLGEQNIAAIISGGMGQRAVDLFREQNIEVILGATGEIEDVLQAFLNGELYSKGSVCTAHANGCEN